LMASYPLFVNCPNAAQRFWCNSITTGQRDCGSHAFSSFGIISSKKFGRAASCLFNKVTI
jgi:hypothetical protein